MTCTPLLSISSLQRFSDNFGPLPSQMPGNGTGRGKSADEGTVAPSLCRWKVACRKRENLVLQARMRRGMLAMKDEKGIVPSKSGTSPKGPSELASGIGISHWAALKPSGGACACKGKLRPGGGASAEALLCTLSTAPGFGTRGGLTLEPLLPLLESPLGVLGEQVSTPEARQAAEHGRVQD